MAKSKLWKTTIDRQEGIRMSSLPSVIEPYWRDSVPLPSFPKLEEDVSVDVVVVGGGIIYEHTPVADIEQGERLSVVTRSKRRVTWRPRRRLFPLSVL